MLPKVFAVPAVSQNQTAFSGCHIRAAVKAISDVPNKMVADVKAEKASAARSVGKSMVLQLQRDVGRAT